jgi:RNA polymerase sigma-70 factor (ECF subfamily)
MKKKASVAGVDPKNWVTLYGDQLFRYALPRVDDRGTAEDLVQETFLSALKGLNTLEKSGSEKG